MRQMFCKALNPPEAFCVYHGLAKIMLMKHMLSLHAHL